MLAKMLCIFFFATHSVSLAKEDDLVNTVLTAGTDMVKETAKVFSSEPEKYSVDLNALYKKYEVEEKANQARSYLQLQFKRGIELTNKYIKERNDITHEHNKKTVETLKKEDPVLGEKFYKLYEKTVQKDKISEDIVKYILDADKINGYYEKAIVSLKPFEQKLADIVKKFEAGYIEGIKKAKKL